MRPASSFLLMDELNFKSGNLRESMPFSSGLLNAGGDRDLRSVASANQLLSFLSYLEVRYSATPAAFRLREKRHLENPTFARWPAPSITAKLTWQVIDHTTAPSA